MGLNATGFEELNADVRYSPAGESDKGGIHPRIKMIEAPSSSPIPILGHYKQVKVGGKRKRGLVIGG